MASVTLAMPTLGSIDTRMCAFLYALLKTSKHKISITHTSRVDICNARNGLLKDFLEWTDEYLLFLDDDNPPESVDFLDRLVEANKPIISWLVPSRLPDWEWKHRLCIFLERTHGSGKHEYVQQMSIPEGPEVMQIANCGMGCVLIEREVIKLVMEEFERPCETRIVWYYDGGKEGWIRDERMDYSQIKDGTLRFKRYMSEDLMFFERAREFGVRIYAHKWVQCTHIGSNEIISIKTHVQWSQS